MNKNNIIIGIIAVLTVLLMCIGIYIAKTPPIVEETPPPPDPHPVNELANIEALEIIRPERKIPKRVAIRNYTDGLNVEHINALSANKKQIYYNVLTRDSKNYMLIVPYQIGGTLTLTELMYVDKLEAWVANPERVIISHEIGEDYALLLQYDRPVNAKYELKITQSDETMTYQIEAAEGGKVATLEYLVADNPENPDDPEEVQMYHQPVTYQKGYTGTQSVAPVNTSEEDDEE